MRRAALKQLRLFLWLRAQVSATAADMSHRKAIRCGQGIVLGFPLVADLLGFRVVQGRANMASVATSLSRINSPETSPTPEKARQPDVPPTAISQQRPESPDAVAAEDTVTLSGLAPRLSKYPISNPLAQGQLLATPAGIVVSTVPPENGTRGGLQNSVSTKAEGLDKNPLSPNRVNTVLSKPPATALPQSATSVPTLSLQHLDQTLQQIGINPLSISIARREALLSLANDPSALVQYFQTSPANAAQSDQSAAPASQTPNPPSDTSRGTINQTSGASPQTTHVDISA